MFSLWFWFYPGKLILKINFLKNQRSLFLLQQKWSKKFPKFRKVWITFSSKKLHFNILVLNDSFVNDPEDIDEVIEEVQESLQEEIDEKHDEVANDIEADNGDVKGDVDGGVHDGVDGDVDDDVDGDVGEVVVDDKIEDIEEVDTGIETQRQGFNAQYYFISTFDDWKNFSNVAIKSQPSNCETQNTVTEDVTEDVTDDVTNGVINGDDGDETTNDDDIISDASCSELSSLGSAIIE